MVKITDLNLAFVKQYLRIEHNEDDQLLEVMIISSKSFIQSYLNRKFEDMVEVPDELTIPAISLISNWYGNRQIQTDKSPKELLYVFSGILDMHKFYS